MTAKPPAQWLPGQILATARTAAGYSKREAARRAGVTPSFYIRIEDGGHTEKGHFVAVNPSRDKLVSAAKAVGADPQAVLSAAGYDLAQIQREAAHELVDNLPERLLPAALNLLQQLDH